MLGNFLQCAQHSRSAATAKEDPALVPLMTGALQPSIADLAAQASENRERILGYRLPNQLAAGLDVAVDALRQLFRLFAARSARDHVAEVAHDAVSLRLEPLGQLVGGLERVALHAHFPGRVAVREHLLLDVGPGRFVVPPILLVQPVLDRDRPRPEAELL